MPFTIRKATAADIPEIERVMRESISGISSRSYDEKAVASSLQYVAHLDRELVDDGTYFVAEMNGSIVGCGGWSRRAKLYAGGLARGDEARLLDPDSEPARIRAMFVVPAAERRGVGREILRESESAALQAGFRRLELMAMLSGAAMYRALGYSAVEDVESELPDGTPFPLTRMEKSLPQ
ncbi:MAG TPA: GNAT family N-acetyltransferase [Thermoanaerobaculia bacterium]|nr:GNAT family N-acetyltransferase [Thermoanaerobaculia bacterium]